MSGVPGIFSLSRRRFVQSLAMLAAQADGRYACAADGNSCAARAVGDRPASQWVQALPVGNGRLGAMILARSSRAPAAERRHAVVGRAERLGQPEGEGRAPDIRRAVAEGRYVDADQLAKG